jgi:hypothetical protein
MIAKAMQITTATRSHIQRQALITSACGIVVMAFGFLVSPEHFFRAYLVAFNFWLGIALGCLVLLMLQHLTGGAWGMLLRRILEAASRTTLLLFVLSTPLAAGLSQLYVWTHSDVMAQEPELLHKSQYLNTPGFLARAAGYFVVWIAISYLLNRWSAAQDRAGTADSADAQRFRILSAAGLVLYGLTITFASIDWVMSLEPLWYSTIFPPLFAVGQALSGIAFAVLVLKLLSDSAPLAELMEPSRWRDLGNLLLTFIMVWAYLSFSQFLLIWSENLPEEIPWYLYRIRGGWQWIALALVALEFAIPFCLLLSRDVKENPRRIFAVALLVLGMRVVDLFWWVEASFPGSMLFYWLLDLAAIVGMGGIWIWYFVYQLKRQPLLPLGDPYLSEYLPELSPGEAAHG